MVESPRLATYREPGKRKTRRRKERREIKHDTRLRVESVATFILFSTAMMLGMHIVARTTAVTELLRLLVVPIAFAYIFGVMWVAPWAYDRSCRGVGE